MSLLDRLSRLTGTLPVSMGTSPSAATASLCRAMPVPSSSSAISAIGWTVPISLLAHCSDTRIVSSVMRARSFLGDTRPCRSIGARVTRKPCFSRNLAMLSTLMCSASLMITWSPLRLLRRA